MTTSIATHPRKTKNYRPDFTMYTKRPAILPLQQGDRLTRTEFERRYRAMPHLKKAELIEGVVTMPSPISNSHSQAHGAIMGWLVNYAASTPHVTFGDNATVRLDRDNEVQPDALLRLPGSCGGQSTISEDDYIEGAPELIVEIAASSATYDLHEKLNVYRRNGVQEYIVWRVYDGEIDWFQLEEGRYTPIEVDSEGIVHSQVFPGLRLDTTALLKGDLGTVLTELNAGIQSDEHANFVNRVDATVRKSDQSETG